VRGDEGKLRQVLINLLGNAVKFTASGGVSLAVTWRDGAGHFEVADTGFGIAEHEIGMLFQPFQQTESGHRTTEGTGLGLAISRNFVQLMGGDISVRSTLGRGSAFTFDATLPASDGPETRAVARRAVGLEAGQRAYRLAVVDDAVANRLLLRKLLEPLGFEVREASTGTEAVEVWERWRPDLIWMDSRLPEMSGVEATAEIRKREGSCKIVALTASAFEHDREAFLRAGCDGFVAKPYREEEILETLEAQLGVRFLYPAAEEATDEPAEVALTPERLAALPGVALAALHDAAEQGDLEAAHAAIDDLRSHDTALADELRAFVRGYRFDELLDLIEAHRARSGSDGVFGER
jgi:CheY-like chemotaxis protein